MHPYRAGGSPYRATPPKPKARRFDEGVKGMCAIVSGNGTEVTGKRMHEGPYHGVNKWMATLTNPIKRGTGVQRMAFRLTNKNASDCVAVGMCLVEKAGGVDKLNCPVGWLMGTVGLRADGSCQQHGDVQISPPNIPGFKENDLVSASVDTDATGELELVVSVNDEKRATFKVDEGYRFTVSGDGGLHTFVIDDAATAAGA